MTTRARESTPPFQRAELLRYSAFSLPLAMAALPLYVHLPKLYGGDFGMALGILGVLLLATRALDAVSDPVLGWLIDRDARRHRFVAIATPLLALGMVALLMPPVRGSALIGWLALWLIVTYAAFSLASISYQAWGAQLSADRHERTRITTMRESLALIGVLIAAVLPEVFGGVGPRGLAWFAAVFTVLVGIGAWVTVRWAPRPVAVQSVATRTAIGPSIRLTLRNPGFRWLLAVFVFSGIAGAIPSTLFVFFVDDVLQASSLTGPFLALYFGSGAIGMAFWLHLSARYGKRNAWLVGMVCAVVAFIWAFLLGAGDSAGFAVVCVLSGLALGADLALPASILADVIDADDRERGSSEGSYFGLWTFVTKANLAIAAGIALPLVATLGYQPGGSEGGRALAFVYCVVPCVFKLISAALLAWSPLDPRRSSAGALRITA